MNELLRERELERDGVRERERERWHESSMEEITMCARSLLSPPKPHLNFHKYMTHPHLYVNCTKESLN